MPDPHVPPLEGTPEAVTHPAEDLDTIPYAAPEVPQTEAESRGRQLFDELDGRRSIRAFSDRPVPRRLLELAIQTASTAPSGAHRQPWRFVAVGDRKLKRQIREAAEAEETLNYGGRLPPEWLDALKPFGTGPQKPYLEIAPWLVAVFAERYRHRPDGTREVNYYVKESVGLACGMFIAALHRMGLATLPHTPNPMRFLNEILERPATEQAFVLFPVGYPANGCEVPRLERKPLEEVAIFK